jgi:2-methoxy-6-polyprenyl-1,4-benzoquinol methylase
MGMLGRPLDIEADDDTRVYVCDINPSMLNVGKQRAHERGK